MNNYKEAGSSIPSSPDYNPFKDRELIERVQKMIESRLAFHQIPGFDAEKRSRAITYKMLLKMKHWIDQCHEGDHIEWNQDQQQ